MAAPCTLSPARHTLTCLPHCPASIGGRKTPGTEEMPDDLRRARALHAEEFQRVHGRPLCLANASGGEARARATPVLGYAGGHRGPLPADGRRRRRTAGAVTEPPALSAGRGGMCHRGQDAE